MKVVFTLNGKPVEAKVNPGMLLFDYLRMNGIFSVKYGSDLGETGSDTVIINDRAMNASLLLMHMIDGKQIETLESLQSGEKLHPLQEAFLDEGAIQCGYCTPGMIMSIEALLRINKNPTEEEIRDTLASNLCRCTGYVKPVNAVLKFVDVVSSRLKSE